MRESARTGSHHWLPGRAASALRDADARVLATAVRADPEQLDRVGDVGEPVRAPDARGPLLRTRTVDLDGAPASAAHEVVITAGLIAIGLWCGLVPEHLQPVITAAGGITGIKGVTGKLVESLKTPKEALDNRYYFLWKAQATG